MYKDEDFLEKQKKKKGGSIESYCNYCLFYIVLHKYFKAFLMYSLQRY